MEPIRSGIIGTGFMGRAHARAVRSAGGTVVAFAGRDQDRTRATAEAEGVRRVLTPQELIDDPDVDLVHVCTPNAFHVKYAEAAIAAGKHVICEKPLALSLADAQRLQDAADAAGVVHAVPFVYRFYPTVREARSRIAAGDERIWLAHGHYLQDWMSDRSSTNWRLADGASRAFADIGVHWCDLFEFVSGHRIVRLIATRSRLHDSRISAEGEVPVLTEDGVTMLFETDRGASGSLVVSQATPGRKNRLWLSIDGETQSYAFDQENPNDLWIGAREQVTIVPKGDETSADARGLDPYLLVPSGHPQGYLDCFGLFLADVHRSIRGERVEGLPSFADGVRAARLTEAVIASSESGDWAHATDSAHREANAA